MNKKDTRTAILMAAIDLMGQEGLAALSASKLAARVGISKSTLFHHFRSMDEIPLASLGLMSMDTMPLVLPDSPTLFDVIFAIGEGAVQIVDEQEEFMRAYFSFSSNAMFDAQLREGMARAIDELRGQISEMLRPFLPEEGARNLAAHLSALLDGAMMQELVSGHPSRIMAKWRVTSALLASAYSDENSD